MNRYAILNAANIITNVIEGDGDIPTLEAHYSQHFGTTVKHIPPATPAGKGWFWHDVAQAFIEPQPYPSYTLDETTWTWQPPIPKPTSDSVYWVEATQSWGDNRMDELNRSFDQAEADGMPIAHNGTTYHLQCRPLDRTNWLGVKALAELLPTDADTVTIMTRENVPIVLTKPQTLQAIVDIGRYSQALYGARWAVRNAINSATPPTDVQAAFDQALQAILA